MRKRICATLALTVATLGTLGACAPDDAATVAPRAVDGAPRFAQTGAKPRARWTAHALTRDVPLARDIVVRGVFDERGGTVEIREAGVRLDVPAGAVLGPTTFEVTAIAGDLVAYDFAPEGAVFTRPLVVSQRVHGTSWERLNGAQRARIEAGYFTDRARLDHRARTADVAEVLATTPTWSGDEIQFPVHHFSGYMFSWGRSRTTR